MDRTLPKSQRLCTTRAVDRLFGEGRRGSVAPLRYVVRVADEASEAGTNGAARAADDRVRVLVVVPKKLHKRANRRNLLKRRTREAYRLHKELLWEPAREHGKRVDLALICQSAQLVSYSEIAHAVRQILARIARMSF